MRLPESFSSKVCSCSPEGHAISLSESLKVAHYMDEVRSLSQGLFCIFCLNENDRSRCPSGSVIFLDKIQDFVIIFVGKKTEHLHLGEASRSRVVQTDRGQNRGV